MPRSNIKLLTKDERAKLNSIYDIKLAGDMIVVKCTHYDRITAHAKDSAFDISSKVRKIHISKEAIDLWIDKFMDKATLIDVQNAMNALLIGYQSLSYEDVKTQIDRINEKDAKMF